MLENALCRAEDIRATGRASGGARVNLCKFTQQPGNNILISPILIPRTSEFRGLSTQKSYQIMHPLGRKTLSISPAICIFTCRSRIDVNIVDCRTKSNQLCVEGLVARPVGGLLR